MSNIACGPCGIWKTKDKAAGEDVTSAGQLVQDLTRVAFALAMNRENFT
jgi:hypothetical protein